MECHILDIVTRIRDYNKGRDPERLQLKYQAMRQNPFAFLRGTCHLFYERLPSTRVLNKAPLAWICGDLHLENFGSFKGDNRLVYFDLNDFDEAALASCTWDVVRFLSSVLVGAASLGLRKPEALALCYTFVEAYAGALGDGKAGWIEREIAEGMVKELLDGLHSRQRSDFLDGRTVRKGRKRAIRVDGKKALAVSGKRRMQIETFMKDFASKQPDAKFFRPLDVARRIAGTGSLGVDRYAILIEGRGSPDGNYLLDLKEALPSSLLSHLKSKQPRWKTEAERIVGVQQRMQAASPAFLRAVELGRTPYVLRALQPTEDRVALEKWNGRLRRLESVMKNMGELVAWAELRSSGRDGAAIADELIAFGRQSKWRRPLLDAAQHCSDQVEKDWRCYAEAFDDGAVKPLP
jgi:uncharacterized protein (DUF2252 family)